MGEDKNLKTEKAIRDVEVTPGMLTRLTARPASYLRHTYVFVGEKGQAVDVSNLRARVWEPALSEGATQIPLSLEARHTLATKHSRKGFNAL